MEGTRAWKPNGEVSGGHQGLETKQRSVRMRVQAGQTSGESLLDVAKESKMEGKVSKNCLTSQWLGKTHTNNRGTLLYVFVQNPSLSQNWISPSVEMCHKQQFFVLQQRSRFLLQFSKA